jgi:hypothetical protein
MKPDTTMREGRAGQGRAGEELVKNDNNCEKQGWEILNCS